MTVNIAEKDSFFFDVWKKGYGNSNKGFWNTTKGIADANWQYVCYHPYKTAAVAGIVAAVPLIAAYFLSPAYAGFVNTTAGSTYAGMIAGGKGLYALAATNPVFTGLLAAAIVGTIGALIYMNYSKVSQIGEARKLLEDKKPETKIDELKQVFGLGTGQVL